MLYTDDHGDTLPANYILQGASRWLSDEGSWVLGNAQRDSSTTNIQRGTLYRYIGSAVVYCCPGDRTTITIEGCSMRRTRTYSLQYTLHTFNAGQAVSRISKQAHIQSPPPARVFAFADVHEAAVGSGDFSLSRNDRTLREHKPIDRHNQDANLSFADGQIEYRRWKWPKPFTRFDEPAANPLDQTDLDYLWSSLPEGFPN